MKVYASMVINGSGGWGDGFPALWFCEYLHRDEPGREISLYAGGNAGTALTWGARLRGGIQRILNRAESRSGSRGTEKAQSVPFRSKLNRGLKLLSRKPFHHSDFIEKPSFLAAWLFRPGIPSNYDEILTTHHFHTETEQSWASPPLRDPEHGGLVPPMGAEPNSRDLRKMLRMDLNAGILNIMLKEDFIPTLPQLKPMVEAELDGLPEEYVAIQLRSRDAGPLGLPEPTRNHLSGDDYRKWAIDFLHGCAEKWKLPLVVTSDFLPVEGLDLIDATKLSLWAKIKVLTSAKYTYVVHSGFGMIAAAYRGLNDVKLINPSRDGFYRNPPCLLFSNVSDPDPPAQYTVSPPGWVDQALDWKIDFDDAMRP